MTVTTIEARGQILDELAAAIDRLALATACLGDAYDELDEQTADRMEDELFRPVQKAYGRAKRTNTAFARRFGLRTRRFAPPTAEAIGHGGAKALIERAVGAAAEANHGLAELQDSMLPIEAGDPELRAGLAEVRDLVDPVPRRAREVVRVLGR